MINFVPDQVTFGDPIGAGYWDDAHAREHSAFVQAFAGRSPAITLPDYNLLQFLAAPGGARRDQQEAHAKAHALLAQQIGATAVDFSQFNLDDEGDFYGFLGYHATAHAQIRQFLGIS